jgi:predicted adenylyl cyclase CyaB
MEKIIEVKLRVPEHELPSLLSRLQQEAVFKREVTQEDTFYAVPKGLLKLRCVEHEKAELIWYSRPDSPTIKLSSAQRYFTRDPDALGRVLAMGLFVHGELKKNRQFYTLGRLEIHLDHVRGLGHFLEIEVLLSDEETDEAGGKMVRDAIRMLNADHLKREGRTYLHALQNLAA